MAGAAAGIRARPPVVSTGTWPPCAVLLTFGQRTGYLQFNVGAAIRPLPQADRLAERILSERDTLNLLHAAGAAYAPGPAQPGPAAVPVLHGRPRGGGLRAAMAGSAGPRGRAPGGRHSWQGRADPACGAAPGLCAGRGSPCSRQRRSRKARCFAPARAGPCYARACRADCHGPPRCGPASRQRVSPHWLRHAHASHALDRGAAVHVVQHTLGHASLATTTRYVHVQPGESSGHSLAKLGS